jgi:hypothetical protein
MTIAKFFHISGTQFLTVYIDASEFLQLVGIEILYAAIGLHEPHAMMKYSNWGEAPNLYISGIKVKT